MSSHIDGVVLVERSAKLSPKALRVHLRSLLQGIGNVHFRGRIASDHKKLGKIRIGENLRCGFSLEFDYLRDERLGGVYHLEKIYLVSPSGHSQIVSHDPLTVDGLHLGQKSVVWQLSTDLNSVILGLPNSPSDTQSNSVTDPALSLLSYEHLERISVFPKIETELSQLFQPWISLIDHAETHELQSLKTAWNLQVLYIKLKLRSAWDLIKERGVKKVGQLPTYFLITILSLFAFDFIKKKFINSKAQAVSHSEQFPDKIFIKDSDGKLREFRLSPTESD